MLKRPKISDRLPLAVVTAVLASMAYALPMVAQMKALRNADDQFIQGLREQGMSDLLDRFSESDPPKDPIAKIALDISLKEFIAKDLFDRASQASQAQDIAEANRLFLQSREMFKGLLAAQRKRIADHPDDERLPIWQTNLAETIFDRYLPKYYQNVLWHYEFGQPSAEQKEAFESAMIEALQVTSDASYRLDLLTSRASAEAGLRSQLEEMQIWFMTQNFRSINTPYWYAHAAHAVSLLPDDHAYFKAGNRVRGQQKNAKDEKERLRGKVFDLCTTGALPTDRRTTVTAKLLAGRTLIHSSDIDDIDDGVDMLDKVISDSPSTYHGFLATLGKAAGRNNGGEPDVAEAILNGMGSHPYVKNDPTVASRLLAADLLFRLLMASAEGKPAQVAQAYEKAYIPLIEKSDDSRFKQTLFNRWAEAAGQATDLRTLPATVRMGIGEQLTNQGGALAQAAVALSTQPVPTAPDQAKRWRQQLETQVGEAKAILERSATVNATLTGDKTESGPVLARGLYNLGTSQYWLAELKKALLKDKSQMGWQPYFQACKAWLEVAARVPKAEQAKPALTIAVNLLLSMDSTINKDNVVESELRAVYKQAFDLVSQYWPESDAAHDSRLYAGFFLYEKAGDLEKAAEIYSRLPTGHRDFFQASRQMVYAQHRHYRSLADRLHLLMATKPLDHPPASLTADQIQAYNEKKALWQQQHEALKEDVRRKRDLIIDEAELVILDAEEVVSDEGEASQRFAAATALGACRVVLAGIESDQGYADKAMDMLKGFETQYSPAGQYKALAAEQTNPDSAIATLNGLIQLAQQQRILTLLHAKRTDEMAEQAKVMMAQSPDVAASVVNGVLQRVRSEIDREKRVVEGAAFQIEIERAEKNIVFYAQAAVSLGELLMQWAKAQGFDAKRMTAYQLPLAESLMLAGKGQDALRIMEGVLAIYPTNFDVLIRTGRAHLAVYKQNKKNAHYESSMASLAKVVEYYNAQRGSKPAPYWEAWLSIMELMEVAGGDPAKSIPERARMLYGVDENLGGPAFKDRLETIFERNGGVERLTPQE